MSGVLDSVALVVEMKAGAVNPGARRGGASMSQEIDQLLIEPARQAKAFAAFLTKHPGEHSFDTSAGAPNKVDSRRIKHLFCLTVTLERFGPLATQIPRLQIAGLAKPDAPIVPSMSLPDLEIALELLQSPFAFLHYLTRRTAFELKHTYLADELDLLTLYLKDGFSDLHEKIMKAPLLMLYGLSRELDPWFQRSAATEVPKPSRRLSKWWTAILNRIENRKLPRRYELACDLLDLPYQFQLGLERRFKRLCSKVKKTPTTETDNIEAVWVPIKSEVASAVLVAAPVVSAMYPHRQLIVQKLANQAMQKTQTDRATVILVDVDEGHWPYSGIYVLDKS
jgi:hypothetical protein